MARRLKCPVCGSDNLKHKTEKVSLLKGMKPVKVEFFSCQSCGYRFVEKKALDSLHKEYRSMIKRWAKGLR